MEDRNNKRPLWFIFPGMGSQRSGAARDLIRIPVFAATIERAAAALCPYDVDLTWILIEAPEATINDVINSMVSITATQVALVNVLRAIGLKPDGIIGASLGELGAAYADGTLTVEQTVLAAYWIGRSLLDAKIPLGIKGLVYLSWDECKKRCPADVDMIGNFFKNTVIITGSVLSINNFVENLNSEGIVARAVGTEYLMFHSKYMINAAPALRKHLTAVIPNPKPRSRQWISTSLPQEKWYSEIGGLSSADYFVNNIQAPVDIFNALQATPKDAVFVEVSAFAKLLVFLRPNLSTSIATIGLVKKEAPDKAEHLLEAIEKIYLETGNLSSRYNKAGIAQSLKLLDEGEDKEHKLNFNYLSAALRETQSNSILKR